MWGVRMTFSNPQQWMIGCERLSLAKRLSEACAAQGGPRRSDYSTIAGSFGSTAPSGGC